MKVYIGPYTNWIGPHQIAERILFWKDERDEKVYRFGKWLATNRHGEDSWLTKLCQWIDDKKKRTVRVRIDDEDVWGLDSTLAYIIAPALKKLKEQKDGSPFVENEDVPEELRCVAAIELFSEGDITIHDRWKWVLNEMIFAFETINTDWEDQFWKVKPEMDTAEYPEDEGKSSVPLRWKVEGECDWDGRNKMQDRIQNGFRLFGKYYQGLWD